MGGRERLEIGNKEGFKLYSGEDLYFCFEGVSIVNKCEVLGKFWICCRLFFSFIFVFLVFFSCS